MGLQDVVTLCREEVSDFMDAPEGVLGGALETVVTTHPCFWQTPLYPTTGCTGLGGPSGTVMATSLGSRSHCLFAVG